MTRTAGPGASTGAHDFEDLAGEHQALLRHYGEAQRRCSEQLGAQAAEIARLRVANMRLRARLVVRDTALAWEREDRKALELAIPGLPRRRVLARRVELLLSRIQELMRERLHWQRRDRPPGRLATNGTSGGAGESTTGPAGGVDSLEASLQAADLVICRTGCLSHGAYWRVQDHCRRTGTTCVLVERPDALRIVHVHAGGTEDIEAGRPRVDAITARRA